MKILLLLIALNATIAHGQSLLDIVGDFHNDGLDYAHPFIKGKPLSGTLAINTAFQYASTRPNWDETPIDLRYVQDLENLMKKPATSFRYAIEFCERHVGSGNLPSYFAEMRAVEQVLLTVRRGTHAANTAGLINDLHALKAKTKNSEALALILVAIASAEYWGADPGTSGGNTLPWIQLDAAGYLLGWGVAYLDDVEKDWDSGSNHRIRKGVERAVAASMGRWL